MKTAPPTKYTALMPEDYNGTGAPVHMRRAIENYVLHGTLVGHFLSSVIANDLRGACGYADDVNVKIIPTYVMWFMNRTPASCWGSVKKYENWVESGGLCGIAASRGTEGAV
tara:strand:+ start:192 stop:527 length:336 start_codon:yes stop_codon:yes gene_type:complete